MALPSGQPPVFTETNPPAAMMRSNALRSVTRSRSTGNDFARHGSMVSVSPSLKCRMCNWQAVVPRCPPCATPLMTSEHVPQMPSRQSESNAIGSSPFAINPSFTTSSISRNDMSGIISVALYSTISPGLFRSFCRQTRSMRFMRNSVSNLSSRWAWRTCRIFAFVPRVKTRPNWNPATPSARETLESRARSAPARCPCVQPLFVAPRAHFHFFVHERLFVQVWFGEIAGEFPRGHIREVRVVTLGFAFLLELGAKVAAAGFIALERVEHEQLAEFKEVRNASRHFEILIYIG